MRNFYVIEVRKKIKLDTSLLLNSFKSKALPIANCLLLIAHCLLLIIYHKRLRNTFLCCFIG
jgi:hypothetical protein